MTGRIRRSSSTDIRQDDGLSSHTTQAQETRRPLEQSSRLLSKLVTRARELYPNASLDLVGYSIGGLVVLHWAQHYAEPEELAALHSVLLISTPVNGLRDGWIRSVYQRLCLCPILADVHSESRIVKSLEVPGSITRLVLVNNANDWMVNGRVGDGTSFEGGGECSLFKMPALGEPVSPYSPTFLVQLMRNHTQILRDEWILEEMARYTQVDCAAESERSAGGL